MSSKTVTLDYRSDSAKVKSWEKLFRQYVVSQDRAVKRLIRELCLAEAGLTEERKPKCVFVFAGPTGVGKTHLVEVLSRILFDEFDAYTYVDCNMFSERHEVARLVGSPPGYVGFDDDVALLSQEKIDSFGFFKTLAPEIKEQLEAVRRQIKKIGRPKSMEEAHQLAQLAQIESGILSRHYKPGGYPAIILFDEIEKAHRSLFTHLFDIVDKARLSMGNGTITGFRNAYIFMTSNVGAEKIKNIIEGKGEPGFIRREFEDISELIYKTTLEEMTTFFRGIPEFIGRVGKENIIVFNELKRADLAAILEMRLKEAEQKLAKFNLKLRFSRHLKNSILNEASDPLNKILGARPLQRLVKRFVLEPLSNLIMKGPQEGGIGPGDEVFLTVKAGKIKIVKLRRQAPVPSVVDAKPSGSKDEPKPVDSKNILIESDDDEDTDVPVRVK